MNVKELKSGATVGPEFKWRNGILQAAKFENTTYQIFSSKFINEPGDILPTAILQIIGSQSLTYSNLTTSLIDGGTSFSKPLPAVCTSYGNLAESKCFAARDLSGIMGNESNHIWNFQSILCQSGFGKFCEWFLKAPKTGCGQPGCEQHEIYDPISRECISMNSKIHEEREAVNWPAATLCEYRSRCKSVNLGLLQADDLNCYCDRYCVYFNDCCEDAPHQRQVNSTTLFDSSMRSCYKIDNSWVVTKGVLMIDRCPHQYQHQPIKELCENYTLQHFLPDQDIRSIPISDSSTGLV